MNLDSDRTLRFTPRYLSLGQQITVLCWTRTYTLENAAMSIVVTYCTKSLCRSIDRWYMCRSSSLPALSDRYRSSTRVWTHSFLSLIACSGHSSIKGDVDRESDTLVGWASSNKHRAERHSRDASPFFTRERHHRISSLVTNTSASPCSRCLFRVRIWTRFAKNLPLIIQPQ